MMDEKKKKRMLDDEALDQVVGGRRMTVANPNAGYINCRQGPGSNFPTGYNLNNGQSVYATSETVYNDSDGYSWTQLEDGYWVASSLLE